MRGKASGVMQLVGMAIWPTPTVEFDPEVAIRWQRWGFNFSPRTARRLKRWRIVQIEVMRARFSPRLLVSFLTTPLYRGG